MDSDTIHFVGELVIVAVYLVIHDTIGNTQNRCVVLVDNSDLQKMRQRTNMNYIVGLVLWLLGIQKSEFFSLRGSY